MELDSEQLQALVVDLPWQHMVPTAPTHGFSACHFFDLHAANKSQLAEQALLTIGASTRSNGKRCRFSRHLFNECKVCLRFAYMTSALMPWLIATLDTVTPGCWHSST
jgi:hypothetical protein